MTCKEVEAELASYHFGVVSGQVRVQVEAHLLDCRACLQGYLDVKRAIETCEGEAPPSAAARRKLRRAVAAELEVKRSWSWWERPLALAFASCALFGAMATTRAVSSGPGAAPYVMPVTWGADGQSR
jgi:hypothetical protein